MDFLLRHIQKTVDIADGWEVGTLVIENQTAYLQLDNGTIVPAIGRVEINNGGSWQWLTPEDAKAVTTEGWPLFAGLDARMRRGKELI